jgi:hypothetical protein
MKRQMDLVKKILLEIEKAEAYDIPLIIEIEGYDESIINYHIKIMFERGLINLFEEPANTTTFDCPTQYLADSLTWEGHEFLEVSKNESNWKKVKNIINDKGLGFSYDILKALLIQESLKLVGLK